MRACANWPSDCGPIGPREPIPRKSGPAFIYRAGERSAMDRADLARHFTLALSGRANNVAPLLAQAVDLSNAKLLLDVGGGTGIYSAALLQKHPPLKAIVLDRPEVLKVAAEFAESHGVADRLELPARRHAFRRAVADGRRGAAVKRAARLGCRRMPAVDCKFCSRRCRRVVGY